MSGGPKLYLRVGSKLRRLRVVYRIGYIGVKWGRHDFKLFHLADADLDIITVSRMAADEITKYEKEDKR